MPTNFIHAFKFIVMQLVNQVAFLRNFLDPESASSRSSSRKSHTIIGKTKREPSSDSNDNESALMRAIRNSSVCEHVLTLLPLISRRGMIMNGTLQAKVCVTASPRVVTIH